VVEFVGEVVVVHLDVLTKRLVVEFLQWHQWPAAIYG